MPRESQKRRRRCQAFLVGFALLLSSGVAIQPVGALEQEVTLTALGASDIAGKLETSVDSNWLGAGLGYGIRFHGPFWVHLGAEISGASGLSAGSGSELDLRRRSFFARLSAIGSLGHRWELQASALGGTERLQEEFFPRDGGGTIRTATSGFRVGGSAGVSFRLAGRFWMPLQLSAARLSLDGPLESITSTQIGVSAGLAWRFGVSGP